MKRVALAALVAAGLGLPLTTFAAETWKNVAVVDTRRAGTGSSPRTVPT